MNFYVFMALFFWVVALQVDSVLTVDVQVMDVYTVLPRAVLLMFRRYILSPSSGSKCVGWASFTNLSAPYPCWSGGAQAPTDPYSFFRNINLHTQKHPTQFQHDNTGRI
jgi:hypothetical protein